VGHGQTRREYFADVLAESLRRELLERKQNGSLGTWRFRHLRPLLGAAGGQWDGSRSDEVLRLSLMVEDEPVTLAGLLLIRPIVEHSEDASQVMLYSVERGLRVFPQWRVLIDYLSTKQGRLELLPHVPLIGHASVSAAPGLSLSAERIDRPLFEECMDSIIALQSRNLAYALSQRDKGAKQVAVMIDDALDVRRLIDRGLLRLGSVGRWRTEPGLFVETWLQDKTPQPPSVSAHGHHPVDKADEVEARFVSWSRHLQRLDKQAQLIRQAHPSVESCAHDVLNARLAVLGEAWLDASDVRIQFVDASLDNESADSPQAQAGEVASVSLINLLLERVTGRRVASLPADSTMVSVSSDLAQLQAAKVLPVPLINHVLARATQQFSVAYSKQERGFLSRTMRQHDSQLEPFPLSCAIQDGLRRIELSLERLRDNLPSHVLDMFEQILNFPVRDARRVFGDSLVEVYAVDLTGEGQTSLRLSKVFVFTPTSSVERHGALWSPLEGLRVFESLTTLKRYLTNKLTLTPTRDLWLDLLVEPDEERIRQSLVGPDGYRFAVDLVQIDEHFIQQIQLLEQKRQYLRVEHALKWATRSHWASGLFGAAQNAVKADNRNDEIDGLYAALEYSRFAACMPAWIQAATSDDLAAYAKILRRYYRVLTTGEDFLVGIPSLESYSRDQLLAQLNVDFPDQSFEPDAVNITVTHYVPGPVAIGDIPSSLPAATISYTETLTQYALNHFSKVQDAILTVGASDNGLSGRLLTPAYLKALIRSLDVGSRYQELLAKTLDKSAKDYLTRKASFFRQWPLLMREGAFRKKLEGEISATACSYIENVLEMPDSQARQSVNNEDIGLCPLSLIAAPGATPDQIPGCYVIAPNDPHQGPIVLYTAFNKDFIFKEYAGRDELAADIRTSNSLQALFMGRVPPQVQARYGHLSFYLPPVWNPEFYTDFPVFSLGPVTLEIKPIPGNALQFVFEDLINVLQLMAKAQTVTTAQADWESFKYLMTLGAEQILMFAPGRLGLLIAAWQSLSLLEVAVSSASSRRWGEAVSEFIAALSMFISVRRSELEDLQLAAEELPVSDDGRYGSERDIDESEPSPPVRDLVLPEYSWRNTQLPAYLKTRLQAFEVSDIALIDLTKVEPINVYEDPRTMKLYAAVAGKVYEVKQFQDHWKIISDTQDGPKLKLNADEQWELDLQWGLKGGGGVVTRFRATTTLAEVGEFFIIEASGMSEIRRLYSAKARRIRQAHAQAQEYLMTSLDNLMISGEDGQLNVQSRQTLIDFFGVQTPDEPLIDAVRMRIIEMLSALLDPSLSPSSSFRYVVGSNRSGPILTTAFVVSGDPLRRIYLTERFFRTPSFSLKRSPPGEPGFKLVDHYQAATLLHELSHQVHDTYDIAYVEASTPFLDLLNTTTAYRSSIKADLTFAQQCKLSHRTPRDQLFKLLDEQDDWRDVTDEAGEGKSQILKITGTNTLEEARTEFFANEVKRREIILSNADSVTLLVTLLGRERYVFPV
jgi:Arc/MetJ family transcription regulator